MYSVMNIKCCWSFRHVLENIIQQYAFLKLTWQFDNSLTAGVCVWLCPCVPAHSICVFSITGTTEIQSLNRFSARVLSLSIFPCSTHHPKMQLSHVEYPGTCFSTFWQINHMSTSAQCTVHRVPLWKNKHKCMPYSHYGMQVWVCVLFAPGGFCFSV